MVLSWVEGLVSLRKIRDMWWKDIDVRRASGHLQRNQRLYKLQGSASFKKLQLIRVNMAKQVLSVYRLSLMHVAVTDYTMFFPYLYHVFSRAHDESAHSSWQDRPLHSFHRHYCSLWTSRRIKRSAWADVLMPASYSGGNRFCSRPGTGCARFFLDSLRSSRPLRDMKWRRERQNERIKLKLVMTAS